MFSGNLDVAFQRHEIRENYQRQFTEFWHCDAPNSIIFIYTPSWHSWQPPLILLCSQKMATSPLLPGNDTRNGGCSIALALDMNPESTQTAAIAKAGPTLHAPVRVSRFLTPISMSFERWQSCAELMSSFSMEMAFTRGIALSSSCGEFRKEQYCSKVAC